MQPAGFGHTRAFGRHFLPLSCVHPTPLELGVGAAAAKARVSMTPEAPGPLTQTQI